MCIFVFVLYYTFTIFFFFFFNDTATTEIYTLSLHDALPIYVPGELISTASAAGSTKNCCSKNTSALVPVCVVTVAGAGTRVDRKSTRLNSSHSQISYAVFCLKKKKINKNTMITYLQLLKSSM